MQAQTAAASASLRVAHAARSAKLAEFEERRFARALHVPTDDSEVKQQLRQRRVPICLFGEDAHDRRERLRALLAREALSTGASAPPPKAPDEKRVETADAGEDEYYTQGVPALRDMRAIVARASLAAAAARLRNEEMARKEDGSSSPLRTARCKLEEIAVGRARNATLRASQRANGRPLCAVAMRDSVVVTGALGGAVSLWDLRSCELQQTLSPHDARVSMVELPSIASDALLTASADGTAALLRTGEGGGYAVRHVYRGHDGRVTAVRMHPLLADVVATAGFDGTVRLWHNGEAVGVHRSGHRRATWLHFHPDGGLLASSGSEGGVRLWDMRSGRAVLTMEKAHAGEALRVAFSGDGRLFASAGADNATAVWDLRRRGCVRRIAAHSAIVSSLMFTGGVDGGDLLATAGFDGTVKLWSVRRDFALVKAHTVHEDKVMAIDVAPDVMVSACYDRTWKVVA